jgi:hypothetical protein
MDPGEWTTLDAFAPEGDPIQPRRNEEPGNGLEDMEQA